MEAEKRIVPGDGEGVKGFENIESFLIIELLEISIRFRFVFFLVLNCLPLTFIFFSRFEETIHLHGIVETANNAGVFREICRRMQICMMKKIANCITSILHTRGL